MKNLTYILMIAFLGLSFSTTLFSQETKTEIVGELYHHSLTANLNSGAYIAKILYRVTKQAKMNKQFFSDQLKLMGNSLESAKKNLEIIQSSLSTTEKEQVKKNMESLQKRVDTAIQNYDVLSSEFALGKPNMAMMKEYISNIYYNLKEAELVDHIAMKNILNIEELKEPLRVEQKKAKDSK
jgi:hypothetical protein